MKKFFLSLVAGLAAIGASAADLVWQMDWSEKDSWSYYVMGYEPTVVDGVLTSTNPMNEDGTPAWYQYFLACGIPTTNGMNYQVVLKCKASEEGCNIALPMRWSWSDGDVMDNSVYIPTEWTDVAINYNEVEGSDGDCDLILQTTFAGTIEIATVKVYESKPGPKPEVFVVDEVDYTKLSSYPYEDLGYVPEVGEGGLTATNPGDPDGYTFYAMDGVTFDPELSYGIVAKIKGSEAGSLNVSIGDWGAIAEGTLKFSTEWSEVELECGQIPAGEDGPTTSGFVMFDPSEFPGTIELEWVKLAYFVAPEVKEPVYEWIPVVANGNAADGQSANMISRVAGSEDVEAPVVEGPDGSGKVFASEITDDPTEPWSCQFFIVFDEPIEAGTKLTVDFDYYCTDSRKIDTQAHGEPGSYQHYEMLGTLNAGPEWKHKAWEGKVSGSQAGAAGLKSIAFNLSSYNDENEHGIPAAAMFYINNVVAKIEVEVPDDDPNAINTVKTIIVPIKGVYNLQGVKVADSIEEVTVPGLYIANGKKVIKK